MNENCDVASRHPEPNLSVLMVASVKKSVILAARKSDAAEERQLAGFNRMIAKAAPRVARENAAALSRFHRGIAEQIRRAG